MPDTITIWHGALIGIGATVTIDIWGLVLWKLFQQPLANWGLIGRWAAHTPALKFFHDNIREVPPIQNELTLGWIVHYGTGVIFGLAFGIIVGSSWFADPTVLQPLLFGLATVLFPWLLLQPGLGVGWAASKTPRPWKTRVLNLISHGLFGIGLWASALLLHALK
ncbi:MULTISPECIES: DUF2938 domain-containing protein [unclassified Mesorhizobium]|uniref:DUF2938 domain-containing protein n=1 Tax=unclassified Mesorhizobium TaxID=325217 RepID=UPI001FEFC8E0|nr:MULTISPECIES: DUF2938 domain-containing protein [unclassified Mesorhizobium]